MPLSDIEPEDFALVGAIGLATLAAVVDTAYGSPFFKAVKIFAMLLSLGLALHRVRTSKPFLKDVSEQAWRKTDTSYEVRIGKAEHGRGKYPHARCLVPGDAGGYTECWADAQVRQGGDVVVQVSAPASLRVEIRK
jgi:hypothetical protein